MITFKKITPEALLFLFLMLSGSVFSQVIWTDPAFPKADDEVTVFFDATQGNAGLLDCDCTVYVHTGVIVTESNGPSDWRYVPTEWGIANPDWAMTKVAGKSNLYKYTLSPSIRAYYGAPQNEIIEQLAFVFRNADGSLTGKGLGSTDIFYDVYADETEFTFILENPTIPSSVNEVGDSIRFKAIATQSATFTLTDNGQNIFQIDSSALLYTYKIITPGSHLIEIKASTGTDSLTRTYNFATPKPIVTENLPNNTELGINYINDSTVTLALYAPNKEHVFLIGDFNDWALNNDYQLKRTPNQTTWWITVEHLSPGEIYGFQYLVDGKIRIADPYTTLILDPQNDGSISPETYPDIPPYPYGKTNDLVGIMEPGKPAYDWQTTDFKTVEKTKLVIYELLMRDFLEDHSYQSLKDTLDYFKRLGVNAIELMPVNEFNGNKSWGYDPTFHLALDKYYGTREAFKAFVDAAHSRGIAVILDVVFNHVHEKNPMAKLYWNNAKFQPSAENPWLNEQPKHNFNVFFDCNHDSGPTQYYVQKALKYWLEEYKIDGFRFDLSKGFTQNIGGVWDAWGYDIKRIAVLKKYADAVWNLNPEAYVILEHFTDKPEETELSNYGMMLWGGYEIHNNYLEASMGYPSTLSGVSYKSRGWQYPNLIAYMESHDEERMMYKNLEYGNSEVNYSVKELETALERVALSSAFFYTIPGPKMLWQFGELGFDYSINWPSNTFDDRLTPKPIRWDYLRQPPRERLFISISRMLDLRNNNSIFQTTNFELNVRFKLKTIHLNENDKHVAVLGNFDVIDQYIDPAFQNTGWWYEFFSGDSILISDVHQNLRLNAGEYRLYSNFKLTTSIEYEFPIANPFDLKLYPNPTTNYFKIEYTLDEMSEVELSIFSTNGTKVYEKDLGSQNGGNQEFHFEGKLENGIYFIVLKVNDKKETMKLFVQ